MISWKYQSNIENKISYIKFMKWPVQNTLDYKIWNKNCNYSLSPPEVIPPPIYDSLSPYADNIKKIETPIPPSGVNKVVPQPNAPIR